jgi:hypothetical protein
MIPRAVPYPAVANDLEKRDAAVVTGDKTTKELIGGPVKKNALTFDNHCPIP